MGPVAQVVSAGAALTAACALALCAAITVAVLVIRASRRRRADLDAALSRSRDEVDALSRKVEELSDEVVRTRRSAEADREYVITSLGSGEALRPLDDELPTAVRRPVTKALEEQLVQALASQPRTSVRTRGIELVVRIVALGHGVRRALSADVLDRAAAEAHVARRRSRRDRKRQLRQARRVRDDRTPGRVA